MAQRVYVVMDGKGKPLGFGTKIEAVAAAEKHATQQGGIAVLQEPDPKDAQKVQNPPIDPDKLPDKANEGTALPQIIEAKYGVPYLSVDLVESITLQEALALCRPYLPQAEKYNGISDKLLGGQGIDLLAADAKDKPIHNSFGLLSRNAKLAKGDSPDGRTALAFGLSLAPHQVGMRLSGTITPRGWEPPADYSERKFTDRQFDAKPKMDVAAGLSELAGVKLENRAYTTCFLASDDCRASCLVHSGQNSASVEALTSKLSMTRALYAEPAAFCRLLLENLRRYFTWGGCGDLDLYVRLNVFSDIMWELIFPDLLDPIKKIAQRAPDGNKPSPYPVPVWDYKKGKCVANKDAYEKRPVTGHGGFYDYTKVPARMEVFAKQLSTTHKTKTSELLGLCKDYYHLTFSFSGSNDDYAKWHLDNGGKVAAVFVLERLEKYEGKYVKRGAETTDLDAEGARVMFKLPRTTPVADLEVLAQLALYADKAKAPNRNLAAFLKSRGMTLPYDVHPDERAFWAAEAASVLGYGFKPKDFRLSVTTHEAKQLRGLHEGNWFYGFCYKLKEGIKEALIHVDNLKKKRDKKEVEVQGFVFETGPFEGYPVINADRNDLRAKDNLIMQKQFGKDGPALVGLDFKVAKIRMVLDEYAIVVQQYTKDGKKFMGGYDEQAYFETEAEAKAALRSGNYPDDAFVRRLSETAQVKLDLEKNAFVTPVYKEGDLFYVAQTPSQTMDGSQEHG